MKRTTMILALAVLLLAGCAAAPPPPPQVAPQGDDRFLVDPLLGSPALAPAVAERFEAAYRFALADNEAEARRRLDDLRRRNPDLVPATLLEALMAIRAERYDEARRLLDAVRQRDPENLAARIYEAEIAVRESQTRAAYDLYRQIAAVPGAPATASERLRELSLTLFNELYTAARGASDEEAIRLLREALAFDPGAVDARILLSQKLLSLRRFDEARTELDPLLNTAADRPDVQQILAEIDVGRGRYQEAIVRYDRLARRTKDPRYEQRLEEIKAEWSAANMPPQYRAALESVDLTRADLAVLLYWTVPSVRFAQNLSTPQIAVDIEDVAGREEIIRAIAIGLLDVDPVTRRVGPYRTVNAARLSHHLARLLALRGAACARGVPHEQILASCKVEDPLTTMPAESPVTGRAAQRYLAQAAKQL